TDAVDAGVRGRVDVRSGQLDGEALVLGHSAQLERSRLLAGVVEPHESVGGEVALVVGGALDADLEGVGHGVQQTRAPVRVSTGLSAPQWSYCASSCHAPAVTC